MSPSLAAIVIYPVKSCAGLALQSAVVEPRGLRHDRRWMLVDDSGRFITGRQSPSLVRVRAEVGDAGSLRLRAPGMLPLQVAEPDGSQRVDSEVWGSEVNAADAGAEAADWFSRYLGRTVRLLFADEQMRRAPEAEYSLPGDQVGFADGYPLLLLSSAAAELLSSRAGRELGWRRFRPNLVIDGVAAHAEDRWKQIRIGSVLFDVVKPCTRCVFTTIDPDSGAAESDGEPLRTLKDYRRGAGGIRFGQNLIARSAGEVQCGDRVEVIEQML
ncbi:MAG: MOSC N-terminal beta barrel domain-containing protein [Lysobacterales bacterium]